MKIFLTAVIATGLCLAPTFTHARQVATTISGVVLEADQHMVAAATVSLIKDSAVICSTITDINGKFILDKVLPGRFVIKVSAVGFKTYLTSPIQVTENAARVQLPAIIIQQAGTALKTVNVTARRAMIEQKLDRTVVNVSAFISNTGATAFEALEKVPGVVIDENGTITYKGKDGIMVLIDDRPTYLSGNSLANYLKALPASQLDKIELMTNPPARYDASGNAGVINIRTKKFDQKGFNGSLNIAIGKAAYWRNNQSLAFNYRVNKLNLFFNSGYNFADNYRRLDVNRRYFDLSGSFKSSYTEEAYFHSISRNPNFKAGADYYLSRKNILGIMVTAGLSKGNTANPMTSTINSITSVPDSTILADNATKSTFKNGSINLNYTHQFDSLGRTLGFDADYLRYDNLQDQEFRNATYNAAGANTSVQHITANLPTLVNIHSVKADYTQPLPGKAKLSAGVKASFVNTDNEANYLNLTGNTPVVDLNNTNHFIYSENIQAGYFNLNRELKRFAWQLGLRAEHTDVRGHQLGNLRSPDSSFTQHYLNLFPTVFFSYKMDTTGHHQLIASYGRRVDRPYYQDLNPFVFILDKYSTFQGNPFLRPQFSNNFQASYNYKTLLTFALAYSRIDGFKTENDYQQGNVFVATSVNLGHATSRSASLNINLSPFKDWNMNTYLELNNNTYTGQLTTSYLNVSQTFFYAMANNQFTFGKGWGAELVGFYNTSRVYAQFVQSRRSQINAGLQKKLFGKKMAIKITVRDIFKGNFSAGEIKNVPGLTAHYRNDFANRSVTLGMSYNFGKTIKNQRKHDATGAETEASRVKN